MKIEELELKHNVSVKIHQYDEGALWCEVWVQQGISIWFTKDFIQEGDYRPEITDEFGETVTYLNGVSSLEDVSKFITLVKGQ